MRVLKAFSAIALTLVISQAACAGEAEDFDNLSSSTVDAYIEKYRDTIEFAGKYKPKFNVCFTDDCTFEQSRLIHDFGLAYGGDYQGQRNVAFCLIDGCMGAIATNASLGCAWRAVILVSDDNEVDDSDRANWDYCKEKIGANGIISAIRQAKKIYQAVYKAKMPVFLP